MLQSAKAVDIARRPRACSRELVQICFSISCCTRRLVKDHIFELIIVERNSKNSFFSSSLICCNCAAVLFPKKKKSQILELILSIIISCGFVLFRRLILGHSVNRFEKKSLELLIFLIYKSE